MIRATTPTHIFRFDSNPSGYSKILVTYSQNGNIVIEKTKADMVITSEVISGVTYYYGTYSLTQEETNKFTDKYPVKLQVRVLTTGGSAMASAITNLDVNTVLNDEVL